MGSYESRKVKVGELFNDFSFRIPIYQRNFDWAEEEIYQLLTDINSIGQNQKYYLGTLVLYKSGHYHDVIDGQQRLTTLFLLQQILSVWKHDLININNQLTFESRPKTTDFFQTLTDKSSMKDVEYVCANAKDLDNFKTAIFEINKFFEQELKGNIEAFIVKCLDQTLVFTTSLPDKTDVNHYFEIMNNRGEQLEKHEILKAEFLNKLDEKFSKQRFAKIWDACSQMDNHVQYFFDMDIRKILFTDNLNTFPYDETVKNYLQVKKVEDDNENSKTQTKDEHNGFEILKNHKIHKDFKQGIEYEQTEKFKSIIDFENLMLQVLSLMDGYEKTNLEDKNLLKNFGYRKDSDIYFPDSFLFIKKLLQVRFLFDKYVIKREIDENNNQEWEWSILSFSYYDKTYKQNQTFSDEIWNKKLVMIQSMFQVTYSTNVNKTWLQSLLRYLFHNEFKRAENIYDHLFQLMQKRFKESGFEKSQGLHTPRAVFNFLDFILWLDYIEKIKKESNNKFEEIYLKKINEKLKNNFSNFKFTQRNSIEHFFPQSKKSQLAPENNISKQNELIDSFGNLCLISSSSNSSYNKEHPIFKKSKGRSKNESLKQQIMFEMMEGDSWGSTHIKNHREEMIELLNNKLV